MQQTELDMKASEAQCLASSSCRGWLGMDIAHVQPQLLCRRPETALLGLASCACP